MIKFVKGNIFDEHFDIRINTVNCVGIMGKGIALQFKKRYYGIHVFEPINFRDMINE